MKNLLQTAFITFIFSTQVFAAPAVPASTVPAGAKVHFVTPKDGATVPAKFTVKFSVVNMKLEKSGAVAAGSGHHHLIVDGGPVVAGEVVPKDATHIHLGNAQTEHELSLAPGKHTLTLQFADGAHMSYGPQMSETISITVK